MKATTKVAVLAAAALLISAPGAFAGPVTPLPAGGFSGFHVGGVGQCEGCHSMHNSFEGAAVVTGKAVGTSGPFLLRGNDQSSACLNCHESSGQTSYAVSTSGSGTPAQFTPAGDFAWLKKTLTGTKNGQTVETKGERRGHNIIAQDQGYVADGTLSVAPGGTYPKGNLACSSCHDPHGKYRRSLTAQGTPNGVGGSTVVSLPIANSGSFTTSAAPTATTAVGVYRLLAGVGYQPKSLTGGSFAFANPAPDAVVSSSYNAASSDVATVAGQKDLVAYGQGMSEWCANCHTGLHNSTYPTNLRHPAGNAAHLTADIVTNYNSYITTGIMTPNSNQYSALAPFELGSGDYDGTTGLKAFAAAPTAATTSNNVLCLSCHRAHASGFESMTRYYLNGTFMTVAGGTYDNTGAVDGLTSDLQVAAYNGRPATAFGAAGNARNYCNKCHAKD